MEKMSIFDKLFGLNVNSHVEKKDGLSYLSWTYAWAAVKKIFPEANYKIHLFGEKQLPYVFDEGVGYMVFTSVTIGETTHTMWLPVMNGANKAGSTRGHVANEVLEKIPRFCARALNKVKIGVWPRKQVE